MGQRVTTGPWDVPIIHGMRSDSIDRSAGPPAALRRLAARRDLLTAIVLASIVLVGAIARFTGIDWGRPFVYHPDEATIVKTAMRMVANGDWNPHDFSYPSLVIDMNAGIVALGHAIAGWPLATVQVGLFGTNEALPEQFDAFLASRVVVACLGLATIVVTYAIGRRLGGRLAGLIAAAIVALAPVHIESSRYAMTDVPVTLLCALVLLASIRASEEPDRARWWLVAAGLVGLATSAKWTGGAVGIVPFVLFVTSRLEAGGVATIIRSRTPWLMLLSAVLALVATTPSLVLATGEVANGVGRLAVGYGLAKGPGTPNSLLLQIGTLADGFGPAGLVMTGIGWLGLLTRRHPITWAMAIFIAVYVAILSLPVLYYPRNALPALPFIAVSVGLLPGRFGSIADRWRAGRYGIGRPRPAPAQVRLVVAIVIALALVPALSRDVADARRLRKPDTRSVAYAWMLANVPHNAIIARELYTPQFAPDQFRLRNHDGLYQRNMAWYRDQHVEYLIASSAIYLRYVDNPARPFDDAFYRALFALPEVFHIDPGTMRPGPTIRIFRLTPAAGTAPTAPSAFEPDD